MSLVPVVQLRRADAPSAPFPPGRDLLQVLWCPFDHIDDDYCPLPQVHWRDSSSVTDLATTPAAPAGAPDDYVPNPCVVHPEQVTDYPSWDMPPDLDAALADRFAQLERDTGWKYQYHLAEAPGIKLGGYPGWTQDPVWPDCPSCGRRMQHLLTVASIETDAESWRTWGPIEDRKSVDGQESYPDRSVSEAAGLMLGDVGGVYIFECQSCPDRPYSHRFDCS